MRRVENSPADLHAVMRRGVRGVPQGEHLVLAVVVVVVPSFVVVMRSAVLSILSTLFILPQIGLPLNGNTSIKSCNVYDRNMMYFILLRLALYFLLTSPPFSSRPLWCSPAGSRWWRPWTWGGWWPSSRWRPEWPRGTPNPRNARELGSERRPLTDEWTSLPGKAPRATDIRHPATLKNVSLTNYRSSLPHFWRLEKSLYRFSPGVYSNPPLTNALLDLHHCERSSKTALSLEPRLALPHHFDHQ